MEPASVVGLVAACASLVRTCASLIKTLHNVAGLYRDAELSILSLIEVCETTRFAWTTLEEWANKNISTVEDANLVLQRFQRSLYAGQLIMGALEQDVAKAIPKIGVFRRRANLVWNAAAFQEHQARIRDQNAALQLLLQVLSMPRKQDRLETMSVKEHVFRQVDDSVLSIIPSRVSSRLSSRLSISDSETSSIRTRRSVVLKYVPFAFEDDLFTSYVYKRNYRLPLMRRNSFVPRRKGAGEQNAASHPAGTVKDDDHGDQEFLVMPEPTRTQWSDALCITPRDGIDVVLGEHIGLDRPKNAILEVQRGDYITALSRLKGGVDVLMFFQPGSPIRSVIMRFLWHVWMQDGGFFDTILERIAFSAGQSWVRQFKEVFLRNRPPGTRTSEPQWSKAEAAGGYFDWTRPWHGEASFSPSVLQLCCAAGNCAVAAYVISIGFRPQPAKGYKHPFLFARIGGNVEMENLISAWMEIPSDIFTAALLSLFTCTNDSIYWCDDRKPTRTYLNAAMTVFLQHGANVRAWVWYSDKYVPLIHAAIFELHCNEKKSPMLQKMLGRMIELGADGDIVAEVCGAPVRMSCLALMASLDDWTSFETLSKHGARVFWWSRLDDDSDLVVEDLENVKSEIARTCPGFRLANKLTSHGSPGAGYVVVHPWDRWEDVRRNVWKQARVPPARGILTLHAAAEVVPTMAKGGTARMLGHMLGLRMDTRCEEAKYKRNEDTMANSLKNSDYQAALLSARKGADVALVFDRQFLIPLETAIRFLCYIAEVDAPFLNLVLKRMALGTKSHAMTLVRMCICSMSPAPIGDTDVSRRQWSKPQPQNIHSQEFWNGIYVLASLADKMRGSSETLPYSGTAFQIAALINDRRSIEYLLHSGYRPGIGSANPTVIAAMNHCAPLVALLMMTYEDPSAVALEAMEAVLAEPPMLHIPMVPRRPSDDSPVRIMRILLDAGVNPSISIPISADGDMYPLLFAVMASRRTEYQGKMVDLLIRRGANPDSLLLLGKGPIQRGPPYQISALALAAILRLNDVVDTLLHHGAKNFLSERKEVFDTITSDNHHSDCDSFLKAILALRNTQGLVGELDLRRFENGVKNWHSRHEGENYYDECNNNLIRAGIYPPHNPVSYLQE